MGLFNKMKIGLKKTHNDLAKPINEAFESFEKIDDDLFERLEEILIMSDVSMSATNDVISLLKKNIKEKKIKSPNLAKEELKSILIDLLSGDEDLNIENKPAIILVVGVNGVGKTTSIGKMAKKLMSKNLSVTLAAGDTFRAGAIEQLEIWANRVGANLIKHKEQSDPGAVIFDAIVSAKKRNVDVVICDTAGRLHNKKSLMDELAKINRIIDKEGENSSRETLLVIDASTGQNGVNQAKEFKEITNVTGVILTKLDGTAKGGIVISIKHDLDIPIKFIGIGESDDDLEVFNSKTFVDSMFDENN